jgi:hypothetical protein
MQPAKLPINDHTFAYSVQVYLFFFYINVLYVPTEFGFSSRYISSKIPCDQTAGPGPL